MSIALGDTLDPRHADPLQPNAPSCGNQPAHISLTRVATTRFVTTPSAASTEAPFTKPDGRRLTLPT
jgi:hypothetical protein